ncbi:MAG: sulfate/molybdate ABC transporter ATP-binding protein [Coriobacteriales bacterium]
MALEIKIKKHLASFDLDIELTAGAEAIGFLGASGCGKSLTLRCVAGVETPDEGYIIVNGKTFFDSEKKINLTPQQRKTALLFQNYQLFPNMTVAQNVAAGMPKGLPKDEVAARVKRYLGMFDLDGFQERYPMRLSGGQQQRVALARMLAAEPDVLMLDEPFSALDSHLKSGLEQNMLDVFDDYHGTILYVSHDIDEAFRLCDRIAVVSGGKIEEMGSARDIVLNPTTLAGLKLSGCKNISRAVWDGDQTIEALDWGISLRVGPDAQIPQDLAYIGARAKFIRLADPGETGHNLYQLKVHRVVENRFDALITLETPAGAGAGDRTLIYWRVDKLPLSKAHLPQPGEVIPLHFDARHLYLATR